MKIFKIVAGVLVAATAVVVINATSANAQDTAVCDVPKLALGAPTGKNMEVNGDSIGDTITATFEVTGENCTTPVTLAVWKTVNGPEAKGSPIEQQVFFGSTTKTYGPGKNQTITAVLPNCYWQADLLVGSNPKAPDGTAHYAYQNGQILSVHPLRDFTFGGKKSCAETPKTPEQPKGKGADTPQVAAAVTPTPTTLPATGAGAVAGTFIGISSLAGVAHAVIRRLRK